MPMKVSVAIPYFQREPEILKRALTSVSRQRLSEGVSVHIVVVDDGSPWPAQAEVDGLSFSPPFFLTVIKQENGGVGAARNAALKSIDPNSTYIAFLDSDDEWDENHLEQGIQALQAGYDFYFCDHRRIGHHSSYFAACYPQILRFAETPLPNGCAEIPVDALVDAVLKGFPTQASTVIFQRDVFPDLRFDQSLRSAGEDMLFFTQLAAKTRRACFSTKVMVEYGKGVNIYFGNFHWDSPARLAIAHDQIVARSLIAQCVPLAPDTKKWLETLIASYKRDFVFLCLRYIAKRWKIPPELSRMASGRMWYPFWFALTAAQIAISMPLGLYRPR
jgi:succinoglycan biosynthesis protein ExoW